MNDGSSFTSLRYVFWRDREKQVLMSVRRNFRMVVPCCVCQATARYSYYGAIVCDSCKIFFRRHAQLRSCGKACRWDKRCSVHHQTGRRCSTCRFAKCLANGMQRDLIRCSRSKQSVTEEHRSHTELMNSQRTENDSPAELNIFI
jgi:hypothetical protein